MKKSLILFILLNINHIVFSQEREQEIQTIIREVTIFFKGAQITGEANAKVQAGKSTIRLIKLSPFINKQSIQIKGDEACEILSVEHQQNFRNQLETSNEIKEILKKKDDLDIKNEDLQTEITILKEKEAFLKSNQNIVGKDQGANPANFKDLTEYYSHQIMEIKVTIVLKERQIKLIGKELETVNSQIIELKARKDLPSSEIKITISSKKTAMTKFNFSYFVENARWSPSYDFRVEGTDKPLNIVYKANIEQTTGIDWNDVKLKLSNANPDVSGKLAELTPYYLTYYSIIADALQGKISGISLSNSLGTPGSGEQLRIRGIGTNSFGSEPLYIVDGVATMDISNISPNAILSAEVIKDASTTAIYGAQGDNGVVLINTLKGKGINNSLQSTNNNLAKRVNIEFELKSPFTMLSDGKTSTVEIKELDVKAEFKYKCIPKLDKEAFLIASILNWEDLDLLDGEINLYNENTYVGKSFLNVNSVSDTLNISIGREKNIIIKKEKQKEYNGRQFIGNKQVANRSWELTIRNNKDIQIRLEIIDQIPVATDKDIQVKNLEISNGQLNEFNGLLKWELDLKPKETTKLVVRYEVKYPKDKIVMVE